MVYRGHVENGLIRLEGSVTLPDGVEGSRRESCLPRRAAKRKGAV